MVNFGLWYDFRNPEPWAIPSERLVIVRLGRGSPGWDASVLPNTLLRGIRRLPPA